jgi:hypothetical protein
MSELTHGNGTNLLNAIAADASPGVAVAVTIDRQHTVETALEPLAIGAFVTHVQRWLCAPVNGEPL